MRSSTYIVHLLKFWRYYDAAPITALRRQLGKLYGLPEDQIFLTLNGRSALYVLLKSLRLPQGSEVIVPSFTCVTAINPVIWAGHRPVYADTDPSTLSISVEAVKKAITPNTRAILIQHTFGIPGPLEQIIALAQVNNILVIEDCAHALGVRHKNKALGTFGDAAIISFGIEKMLSTKIGGGLLINNGSLLDAVKRDYKALPRLGKASTFLWLLYPIIRIILRRLPFGLSSSLQHALEFSGILKQAIAPAELAGGFPSDRPSALPGVHAQVAQGALTELEANAKHRAKICRVYGDLLEINDSLTLPQSSGLGLIKFPVLLAHHTQRDAVKLALLLQDVPVSDWYDPALYPRGVAYEKLGYFAISLPAASDIASRILCLPTGANISPSYATIISNEISRQTDHR